MTPARILHADRDERRKLKRTERTCRARNVSREASSLTASLSTTTLLLLLFLPSVLTKTARPHQGRVEDVRSIGRHDDLHRAKLIEAI